MLKYLSTLLYNHYMIGPIINPDKKPNKKKLMNDYNAALRSLDEDINVENFTSKCLLDLLVEGVYRDKMDRDVDGCSSGLYMLHEAAECYFGGKIALKTKLSSPRSGLEGSSYKKAHAKASASFSFSQYV